MTIEECFRLAVELTPVTQHAGDTGSVITMDAFALAVHKFVSEGQLEEGQKKVKIYGP